MLPLRMTTMVIPQQEGCPFVMVKSRKIYNLIFDLLLTAGVCAYNDLRFMRVWFLGGRLYHATGFANYRFGLTGKEVCWDFSPLNPVSYTHLTLPTN